MGKDKDFEIGDFVFAKVRGYPAWPARIVSVLDPRPATMKFTVFFFGTSETATVQAKEVYPYASNKERFGKPMKRKFFNEGIEELEEEMKKVANGEKSTKGALKTSEISAAEGVNVRKPKANSEEKEEPDSETPTEPKAIKRTREGNEEDIVTTKRKRKGSAAAEVVKEKSRESTTDMKEIRVPSLEGDSAVTRKRKRSVVLETAPDASQSKEQISRSGRVIKPKKFLYDEEGKDDVEGKGKQKTVHTPDSDSKEEPIPKKTRKSKVSTSKEEVLEDKKKPTTPPKLSSMGRVVWARSKCGQLVQVKVDHDRPATFKDEKSRIQWEKAYELHIKRVKQRIEAGEALPDDVPVQLQPSPDRLLNMTEDEINFCKKLRLMERKRGKVRWLKLETRLVDIDVLLKTSLQKTKVDIDKALQLMDELINLPLDPLMLKKHPQLVETTRKIRQYTGNVSSWNMSQEEETKFKKNATKIRQKANILLNKFRGLFAVPKPEDFWSVFLNSVNEFKSLTKHLPPARVYSLIVDPASPYYKEVAEFDNEEEEIMKSCQFEKEVVEKES